MKRDMTGGAVVMAVMAALARMGCPYRVTGLVPDLATMRLSFATTPPERIVEGIERLARVMPG